jgi:hypothetical protein
MPEQGKHRITKLAFQRGITPEQVGGEAGERLKELFDTADSSSRLSNEEMEEINSIIAEHTGAAGVLEAPDLNMLGVTDHLRFFENFSYIRQEAEEAYEDGYYLEAISLRLLTFDLLLRIYVVHKTKQPVKPSIQFGQLLGKAKGQGFPQKLATELEAFDEKRISTIHHYLLGQVDYEEIGGAYRDADGLFERISTAPDLPPLFG